MQAQTNQERLSFLLQLRQQLQVVADEAAARESALADGIRLVEERTGSWQAQRDDQHRQLAERNERLMQFSQTASHWAEDAEAEMQALETSLREWLENRNQESGVSVLIPDS